MTRSRRDPHDEFEAAVIPFPRGQFERMQNEREAALEELPVRTRHESRECWHRQHGSFVSEGARTVTCRGCGVALDPIEVLAQIARNREGLVHAGQRLRRERDYLTREVEELKRQERNAKSRIRTARKRRDDREALISAAEQFRSDAGVSMGIGGYRGWDDLNDGQREVVLGYVRQIVEAYAGALDRRSDEEAEVA